MKYLVEITRVWSDGSITVSYYGKGNEHVSHVGKRIKELTDHRIDLYAFKTRKGAERSYAMNHYADGIHAFATIVEVN